MPDLNTPTNGQAAPFQRGSDPTTTSRHRLAEIIQTRQKQEDRLTQLTDAQGRAHEALPNAEARLSDAEGALQRANDNEQARLAAAYLDNKSLEVDPIGTAQANISTAQADVERLEKIEKALTVEIQKVEATLRTIRANQYSVLSELICESKEYQQLIQAHTNAWKTLRTVKEALRIVTTGCHGYLPQRFQEEAHRVEPLEQRVGFGVDPLFGEWASAMSALENDPDVWLPQP